MLRIIEFKKRMNHEGVEFYTLTLQGKPEIVQSKTTGEHYLTARKVSIPTTYNEEFCKSLLGTEFPGIISRVDTDPYEYTIKEK